MRDDGRLHEEKSGLSSLPAWHTCSVREMAPIGTNSVWMWHVSERLPFSKTLISGPQISCQSSAVHRRGISEKAAPDKSTTCQSHTQTLPHSHRHKRVNSAGTCVNTQAQGLWWMCLPLDSISSFGLIGPNFVFAINSRWLLQDIREKKWSRGLSRAHLINIHLLFILPHWITI